MNAQATVLFATRASAHARTQGQDNAGNLVE